MNTILTTLTTEAAFSDDGTKRYFLRKTWDAEKPRLTIIMLAPSEAAGISLDTTTQLVLNNASRLGYGSITITNLFSTLNDSNLKFAEDEDPENLDAIVHAAENADTIVYAAGVGKAKTKVFQARQEQVLGALLPYAGKLHCLCNADGKARLQHPLSPAVRTWCLSPLKLNELIAEPAKSSSEQKKKSEAKADKATLPKAV